MSIRLVPWMRFIVPSTPAKQPEFISISPCSYLSVVGDSHGIPALHLSLAGGARSCYVLHSLFVRHIAGGHRLTM